MGLFGDDGSRQMTYAVKNLYLLHSRSLIEMDIRALMLTPIACWHLIYNSWWLLLHIHTLHYSRCECVFVSILGIICYGCVVIALVASLFRNFLTTHAVSLLSLSPSFSLLFAFCSVWIKTHSLKRCVKSLCHGKSSVQWTGKFGKVWEQSKAK